MTASLGAQLRAERQRRGLSLVDVREKTGIPEAVVGSWERGDRNIRLGSENVNTLLDLYGLQVVLLPAKADPDPVGTALDELVRRKERLGKLTTSDVTLLAEAIGGAP